MTGFGYNVSGFGAFPSRGGGFIEATLFYSKIYKIDYDIMVGISFNLFQTFQRRRLIIHWDSMSKESYWAFFTTIKMESREDWNRQEKLLIKPNYDKARKGESEYDFEIL